MANGIVRLEDMPSVIREGEVPNKIIVPNPGDRRVVIKPRESGFFLQKQVFTSACLPDEISFEFLGLVHDLNGNFYPRYIADVVTSQQLGLRGVNGLQNCTKTINRIACGLTYQKGMLKAESVKRSDWTRLSTEEKLSYWLAGVDWRDGFGGRNIFSVFCPGGYSGERWLGIRPAIVLDSKIRMIPF